jgi:hypothetical protein
MYNFNTFLQEGPQGVVLAEDKGGKNLHLE